MQVVHAKHFEKLLPWIAKESRWALIRQWGKALFPLTLKTLDTNYVTTGLEDVMSEQEEGFSM